MCPTQSICQFACHVVHRFGILGAEAAVGGRCGDDETDCSVALHDGHCDVTSDAVFGGLRRVEYLRLGGVVGEYGRGGRIYPTLDAYGFDLVALEECASFP